MRNKTTLENCKRCKRLHNHLQKIKQKYPDYLCQPVPAFGDKKAKLLIMGLAPSLHGANASGIPFTGDTSGDFLFNALHKHGFSSHPSSNVENFALYNCRITNAVKCLPPENKPTTKESQNCSKHFLQAELEELPKGSVVLALGGLAHNEVLRSFSRTLSSAKFGHNVCHTMDNGLYLLDSYHCSRYNTQTKRLTKEMFDEVFNSVKALLQ